MYNPDIYLDPPVGDLFRLLANCFCPFVATKFANVPDAIGLYLKTRLKFSPWLTGGDKLSGNLLLSFPAKSGGHLELAS